MLAWTSSNGTIPPLTNNKDMNTQENSRCLNCLQADYNPINNTCENCGHVGNHPEPATVEEAARARYPLEPEERPLDKYYTSDDIALAEQYAFKAGASFQAGKPTDTPQELFKCDEDVLAVIDLYASQSRIVTPGRGWIRVEDGLPVDGESVLTFNGFTIRVNSYATYSDQDETWFRRKFTHWMPLPPSPTNK